MTSFEPVSFLNSAGLRLHGTLHRPAVARSGAPAVILLSPGVKMRVGPGRLYVPITELLNELGLCVLRFDFHGLGDSEGELAEKMLIEIYNHVEVGRYVDDTLCAVRWMRETHGFHEFMVGGLCGGATTAALAAGRDPEIRHMLCLGLAITLSSDAATPARYLTRGELDSRLHKYLRRLLDPRSWVRLLTFQSEYGVIWRSLKRLVFRDKAVANASDAVPTGTHMENANPLFPPAFFSFLQRGGRALLIFSEKDRLPSEYEEKFALPYAGRLEKYRAQLDGKIIANANHVLSMPEWRQEMLSKVREWTMAAARD
jgi:pimeloyl-ACP methyl ester carboxylesterase